MKICHGAALAACLLAAACNDTKTGTPASDALDANSVTTNVADMTPAPDTASPSPTTAANYLAMAGAGDLFEIESSRAVLGKSDDKVVKDFAQMMIEAHSQSTEKLKAAASSAGLTVAPPALTPDQQTKLDTIKNATGATVVNTYIAAQREAHAAALTLHQSYQQGGDTPALKTAAGEIVTVVQHHIAMLAKLPGA
jgi:putative membrane protein